MHISDIVCINNLTIHTNRSLLSPLHMQDKSSVFGLYYPSSHTVINENYMFDHDFMFTPIPPSLWHSIARFVVLLKHEPGCIAGLTKHLKDKKVNIITAESTRAGHRFMYFTLTVEFEELSDKDEKSINKHMTGEELANKQKALKNHVKALKKSISIDCKQYLFQSMHGIEPFGTVEGHIVHSLQYFYYKVGEYYNYSDAFKPFMATIDKGKIVFNSMNWKQIWHNKLESELPTYGFAASSTRDLCLRVCLLDKQKLGEFKKIKFKYVMRPHNSAMSSKGLIHYITDSLKKYKYNIWSIYNTPKYNKTINGDGTITVIAQDTSEKKVAIDASLTKKHVNSIVSIFSDNELSNKLELKGSASNIARCPVFVSVRSKDPDKETYIRDFHKAGLEIGLLENDFIFFDSSRAGENISRDVIDTMKTCSVMIQIHNKSPNKNEISLWLEAECLLAKSLEIPYRVLIHKDVKDKLDIAIESDHTVFNSKLDYKKIKNALHDVIIKKFGSLENMWGGG